MCIRDSFSGLAGPLALEPLWVVSLLANVVTIAFLLMLSYFRNPLADVRWLPHAGGALTAAGTLALSHPVLVAAGGAAAPVYLAGALVTGVGSAIVVVLWAELFASLGSKRTCLLYTSCRTPARPGPTAPPARTPSARSYPLAAWEAPRRHPPVCSCLLYTSA